MKELKDFVGTMTIGKAIGLAALAVLLVVFVWNNFEFITKITFEFNGDSAPKSEMKTTPKKESNQKEGETKTTPQASFKIEDVRLSPVATDMPSYFLLTLQAGAVAPDQSTVNVDLGKSKLQRVEVVGGCEVQELKGVDTSAMRIEMKRIQPQTPIYVYCFLTAPTFNSISVDIGDGWPKDLNYSEYIKVYENPDDEEGLGFWSIIWRVLVVAFVGCIVILMLRFAFD